MIADFRILCLCLATALSGCTTQPRNICYPASPAERLVGTWAGADDKNKQGAVTFLPDGTARLTVEETIAPPAMDSLRITYHVNSRTSPWELDVVITQPPGQKRILRGLIELIDDMTIQIGFASDASTRTRPKSFADIPANRKIKLTRVKTP